MKRIFLFTFLIAVTNVFAQQNKADYISLQKQILNKSKAYGDPAMGRTALYNLIVLEGEQSKYKDSLAYVYFSTRQYAQSFLVAEDILKYNSENLKMLEIKAVSLEQLGVFEKSMEAYKKLFAKTNNNYHGYSQAALEYKLKKYNEAYKTIQQVEKLNDSGKYTVTFAINKTHSQNVELLAAVQYLKGLIALELKDKVAAKAAFEKALKIQPEFVLAKEELGNLSN